MPEETTGNTYTFIPLKGQQSSLEYASYKREIEVELQRYGYRQTGLEDANLVISFGYGIDSGRDQLVLQPVFGWRKGSSSTTHGNFDASGNFAAQTTYDQRFGVIGHSTSSMTQYTRVLRLFIVDKESLGKDDLKVLYEGHVLSVGSSPQLAPVMPDMIKALFKEFPGKSGSTRLEMIPSEYPSKPEISPLPKE